MARVAVCGWRACLLVTAGLLQFSPMVSALGQSLPMTPLSLPPLAPLNWTVLRTRADLQVPTHLVANETLQVGDTAFLTCLPPSGAATVVWIRRSDYYIISGGTSRYVSDSRFQVLHEPNSTSWTLQVKFLRPGDQGIYECQTAAEERPWCHYVRLLVLQPRALIVDCDGPDCDGVHHLHVQRGTSVQLICVIRGGVRPPSYVFWYHDNTMINHDVTRSGGLQVATETRGWSLTPNDNTSGSSSASGNGGGSGSSSGSGSGSGGSSGSGSGNEILTVSKLSLSDVKADDSGNYSCRPPNTEPAFVLVHVSQGDNTAAIQRIGNSVTRCGLSMAQAVCTVLLLIVH